MGELEARHLGALGYRVAIDEPYQHYQFAGRADVVAWDATRRALLHIENRTQFPNVQEAAGAFNAKPAYLPAVLANRFEIGGAWRSVVHVLVGLWSSEVLHVTRLRRSTIAAICPDPIHLFAGWWRGEPPDRGSASIFVGLDPDYRIDRSRRYIDLDAAQRVDPRYRDYADVARRLRAR